MKYSEKKLCNWGYFRNKHNLYKEGQKAHQAEALWSFTLVYFVYNSHITAPHVIQAAKDTIRAPKYQ